MISALITLSVFIVTSQRSAPGSVALSGMLLGMFIWSFVSAFTWAFVPLDLKIFMLKVTYLGVVMVPPAFLIFAIQITHRERWITFRNIVLLIIPPFIITILVWFAPQIMFVTIKSVMTKDKFHILEVMRGVGFWANATYSYLIILFACGLLVYSYRNANLFFKRQYKMILIGSIVPFVLSIYTQVRNTAFKDLDYAPISFGISGAIYAYAILRHQFMNLVPVARGQLIENMSDGVLVLDVQGRIVDINPAMENFLEAPPSAFLGKNVSEALNIWNDSMEHLLSGLDTRTELRLPNKTSRYLDLRVTLLHDTDQRLSGRLIIFRDVTDRKEVERDLRYAMDRLHTQLIEIKLLQDQLREQAIRDALTNLFNRRYLDETLEREIARATREMYPLCIVMMDIDHFKDINDTYSHEAGDLVLKTLEKTIMDQSRQGDFACRYGGEEFVLVMPNIGLKVAKDRALSLHKTISTMFVSFGRYNLNITMSMGVSMFPAHGETRDELLRNADKALYVSKDAGRNRVSVYGEDEKKI